MMEILIKKMHYENAGCEQTPKPPRFKDAHTGRKRRVRSHSCPTRRSSDHPQSQNGRNLLMCVCDYDGTCGMAYNDCPTLVARSCANRSMNRASGQQVALEDLLAALDCIPTT